VIQYLKDSFAYLHKAVAAVDDTNALIESSPISPMPKGTATRIGLAVEVLMHTFDHYWQLAEYLRTNGNGAASQPSGHRKRGYRGATTHKWLRRLQNTEGFRVPDDDALACSCPTQNSANAKRHFLLSSSPL
jgi:hypothetical protein